MTDQAENQSLTDAVHEAASEQLGVDEWDRPSIFREVAESAADVELTYWLVLVLSGAIATLGLALNSSAVVIGAMLVAPLLGPMTGLALSLAMGDGRLAVQTALVVAGSTLLVIAAAALLTIMLPFHEITAEISARTRPTTLDLVIAIFSGLVGAVVTVGRGKRLSAAIPGVAIAVALIPPLAVAGFGVGIGWNFELIRGAMLLYGANLAGIVLSGMLVFLLVGMNRREVLDAARSWHDRDGNRLQQLAGRTPYLGTAKASYSTWLRVVLVGGFVVALGFPLTASLGEISREMRIESAVREAAQSFDKPGQSSILDRQVAIGSRATEVQMRVATTQWFTAEDGQDFERRASTLAGEPVRLELEQLPTTAGDLDQFASLFPGVAPSTGQRAASAVRPLPEILASLEERLSDVLPNVALPDSVRVADLELATGLGGETTLHVDYLAPAPLSDDAVSMLRTQLRDALNLPDLQVAVQRLENPPADSASASQASE